MYKRQGDGEYAELELCDKMRDGEDYTGVQSLYFKMPDGSFKHNPIRPLFSDLDQIPIPDFDLFDYDNPVSYTHLAALIWDIASVLK